MLRINDLPPKIQAHVPHELADFDLEEIYRMLKNSYVPEPSNEITEPQLIRQALQNLGWVTWEPKTYKHRDEGGDTYKERVFNPCYDPTPIGNFLNTLEPYCQNKT